MDEFPITEGNLRIDFSPGKRDGLGAYTVYYWATRPDADQHIDTDKEAWEPDSEHDTLEEAQQRLAEMREAT
jgi:hypothetical protein